MIVKVSKKIKTHLIINVRNVKNVKFNKIVRNLKKIDKKKK